jgi:hypothetical protein
MLEFYGESSLEVGSLRSLNRSRYFVSMTKGALGFD